MEPLQLKQTEAESTSSAPPSGGIPWIRILVEGVVVVGSILVAFAIDAWWDQHQERNRETYNLRMLVSDARQTLANNARFGRRADSVDVAGAKLVRAYYEAELPPRDSLRLWLTMVRDFWVVEPTLGTGHSLVATRDFELIQHDSIRVALPRYLTNMTAFEIFEDQATAEFLAARMELLRYVDVERLRLETMSPAAREDSLNATPLWPLPAGPIRAFPPVNVEALVRNDELQVILLRMNYAKERMKLQRRRMREATETFLGLLAIALGDVFTDSSTVSPGPARS